MARLLKVGCVCAVTVSLVQFALAQTGITQRVEVSSQSETINTTDASLGNAFGET